LLSSEKKTLRRFLGIYLILVIILVATVSFIYYNENTQRMRLEYKTLMQEFAILQTKKLKWLHYHFPKYSKYPRDSRYNSAIYDLEYHEIFSTMQSKRIDFSKTLYFTKNYVVYYTILSDYYLGAKYLFIEIPKNSAYTSMLYKKIAIYATIALAIFFIIGYYLSRLFIKPMRDSIDLLDNFIKDTTHEINTPISIINTNIELVNESALNRREIKILNRVKIASRTLESIYKDLKFLTLENGKELESVEFNLKELIQERVEYFALAIDSKKIDIKLLLKDSYIVANPQLIARVVDNLISNAIKYNKVKGKIIITLTQGELIVQDSGIGIKKEYIKRLFERYSRFNTAEGGFGIGLNIVQHIANRYNLDIKIESEENIGTKVFIKW